MPASSGFFCEGIPLNAQLLTVKEIETALNIGHTKAYELFNSGEIETLKIGTGSQIDCAQYRQS